MSSWHPICFIRRQGESDMTTIQTNSNQVNQYNKALVSAHQPQTKAKTLALAGQDPALSQWVEQNRYVYDSIVNGSSDLSQTDQAQFMDWWNWATGGAEGAGTGWGDDFDMEAVEEGYDDGSMVSADPFGAQPGSMGNLVMTEGEARVGFFGEARPYDIWAKNFILDVSSTAATVTAEQTMDTRFNPAESVVKLTVKDKATGKESVYFLHDVDADTKIKINTPGADKIVNNIADPTIVVTTGEYKKPTQIDPNAAPESSVPAEEIDGNLVVEAPIGQTIELTPAGNGEDQTWEVYGDYNLSVRPSDQVVVTRTGTSPDVYTIEVTHRNGEKDTYLIKPPSKGNLNATPANVSFIDGSASGNGPHGIGQVPQHDLVMTDGSSTAPAEPKEVTVPAGWENLTLNAGAPGTASEDQLGDEPTRMDGETRVFDGQDFNLYPAPEGKNKTTTVAASGTVTINPNSNSEYFKVKVVGNQFVIEVYSSSAMDAASLKETIKVDADLVDSLNLTADPSRVVIEGTLPSNYAGKIKGQGVSQTIADLPENDKNASDIDAIAAETGLDLDNLPAIPDAAVFEFLVKSDTKLRDLLESMIYEDSNGNKKWNDDILVQVRDRVIQLLQVLYPQSGVGAPTNGEWDGDDITFGGREFDIFNNSTGWTNGPWEMLRMSTEDTTD